MVRAAVLGAGSWGTTFAKVLVDAGGDVTLWGRRAGRGRGRSAERHENADYLPGVALPPALRATTDAARGAGRRRDRGAGRAVADAARQPDRLGGRWWTAAPPWSA